MGRARRLLGVYRRPGFWPRGSPSSRALTLNGRTAAWRRQTNRAWRREILPTSLRMTEKRDADAQAGSLFRAAPNRGCWLSPQGLSAAGGGGFSLNCGRWRAALFTARGEEHPAWTSCICGGRDVRWRRKAAPIRHLDPSFCHLDRSGEISRRQARFPPRNPSQEVLTCMLRRSKNPQKVPHDFKKTL